MRVLLVAALLVAGPAAAAEKWTPLFDGKTLNGWTPKILGLAAGEDPLQTFRVKDGAIVVSYDRYDGAFKNRFGHLFWKTPYKAYRLRMEYRFVGTWPTDTPDWAKGNSGVKRPRVIDFMAELPRHPTGKLYKRLIRDAYWGRTGGTIV